MKVESVYDSKRNSCNAKLNLLKIRGNNITSVLWPEIQAKMWGSYVRIQCLKGGRVHSE